MLLSSHAAQATVAAWGPFRVDDAPYLLGRMLLTRRLGPAPRAGVPLPRTRRRNTHIRRFRHIFAVDPGFVADPVHPSAACQV